MKSFGTQFFGVFLIIISVFITVSLIGYSAADPPESRTYPPPTTIQNFCGLPGAAVSSVLLNLFGYAAYFLMIPFCIEGFRLWQHKPLDQILLRTAGLCLALIGLSGLLAFCPPEYAKLPVPVIGPGGYFGTIATALFLPCVAVVGTVIFLTSLTLAGIILLGDQTVMSFFRLFRGEKHNKLTVDNGQWTVKEKTKIKIDVEKLKIDDADDKQKNGKLISPDCPLSIVDCQLEEKDIYQFPGKELLAPAELFDEDSYLVKVQQQSEKLVKKLAEFKIQVKVVDIQTGPVISMFELKLAAGTRLQQIQRLANDLAVAFKVENVRIVAPIPGKNTVGVELPNEDRQTVRLREVMELCQKEAEEYAIPLFLGKDVTGAPLVADMADLPHLLIAGRTGTGKSVCLNSIIVSILMTRTPEQVRMIMIDPKFVEMSSYEKIPHLMHPVVTDMRKASAILAWLVNEMEERYQLLASAKVKKIREYNKLSEDELRRRMNMIDLPDEDWSNVPKSLPYYVVVIDEFGDMIKQANAKENESHIIRLAAKSRAIGIHLILATQKPTVDVVTGLIKSNLPARIAFGVASQSDSRVVLDQCGAERLLGEGDMLFLKPSNSSLVRGQGTFVSNDEIEKVCELVETDEPDFVEELVAIDPDAEDEEDSGAFDDEEEKIIRDDLYYQAVEFVIQQGRGSVSLLQRRFRVGYGRAARMIDFMAEDGVVGPPKNGSKPRDILMSLGDWKRKRQRTNGVNPMLDNAQSWA